MSARLVAVAVALAAVSRAAAQPAPCRECARGDALIDRYSLQPLRGLAAELAAPLPEPLPADPYAHLVELRRQAPSLAHLGALDDPDLAAIASALCHAASGDCVDATAHALRCLADRCELELPPPPPARVDVVELPAGCHAYGTHKRSPPFGLGMDWGTGYQRSKYPSDGGAWSLGLEGRLRANRYLGAVARVDRVSGRDKATDANHDGKDDVWTGNITRISALAGPSFVLDNTRYDDTTRFLRVDFLAGYMSTRSQADESGFAAGVDLAYQIWAFRFGLRVVQGFGDANEATMVLGHIGFVSGSSPTYDNEDDCGARVAERSTPLALGLDLPLGGYGLSSELGYMVPGLGLEAAWHLAHTFDALAHGDLLYYPGYNRDRVLHQALLAGIRIDHGRRPHSESRFFTTVMAGYTHGVGLTPTSVGSGPIGELSVAWGGEASEGMGYLRLHARFGISPDNADYRALFVSFGGELRLDPRRWRDRD